MTPEFTYKTGLRPWKSGPGYLRAEVRYQNGGNPEPYLSITACGYAGRPFPGEDRIQIGKRTYGLSSCGCMHKDIATIFPELAPALPWHCANANAPMHYLANSTYWHELWGHAVAGPPWNADTYVQKFGEEKLREHFLSTCRYGELPRDLETSHDTLLCMDHAEISTWLEDRLPELRLRFEDTLRNLLALRLSLSQDVL